MLMYKEMIKKICDELNIKCDFISKDYVCVLKKGNVKKVITGYKFDLNPHALGLVFDDKYATYEYMKLLNIPVVTHSIIYNENNLKEYALNCKGLSYLEELFYKYNKDIIIKINNGTCGRGVYHVTDINTAKDRYLKLISKHYSLSICPYYEIENEYRVIVLNNNIKLIYKKINPCIYGDGKSTIKELLTKFNYEYFKDYDKDNKDVVLKNNEKYVYDFRFNLSNGAICNFDILKKDKDSIVSIVNEVLKTGIKFGSIDILKSNNEFYVLEVNSGVMMDNLIIENNYYDEAYKIYKDAIRDLFYM